MKKKIKSDINFEQNLDDLLKILVCPKTGSKLLFDKKSYSLTTLIMNNKNEFILLTN